MALYAKIDCAFPEDPKVIEAGDIAELVYLRCVLKCRELLTDGVIHRVRLDRWTVGIRGKATVHAARLVEVGLWELHPDGWRIPHAVWAKWNPLASDVQDKREEEANRKRAYREAMKSQRDNGTSPNGTSETRATVSQRDK